jgi:hypothetical protein
MVALVLSSSSNKNSKSKSKIPLKNKNKIDISKSIQINTEDAWLNKSENEVKDIQTATKSLQEQINQLVKKMEEQQRNSNNIINSLTQQIAEQQQVVVNTTSDQYYDEYYYNELNNYIPAGSYVKARMLSGADVSTGVNSQNDPNNMLFEIISPAIAPKHKNQAQENERVVGCRLMGAAVGQLWTEKAYVRLLKMSCSFEKGKVSEYNVKGYVTSFAKEGVRGKVVSREGYFTSMAFLAGTVEGIANITKTAYSPTVDVASGIATQTLNASDVAKQAGASGMGRAAEMLSDYYIKRAEQYQSVIDVPTGVEVEIVFQEGVDLKKNISFKLEPNKIGQQVGMQMGQDMNSQINTSPSATNLGNRNNNINGSNVIKNDDGGF